MKYGSGALVFVNACVSGHFFTANFLLLENVIFSIERQGILKNMKLKPTTSL